MEDETIMTAEEVGKKLRLSELGFSNPAATVREWAKRGKIGRLKIGRKVAFTQKQLDEFKENVSK